jgi:hypothetical protein
MNIISISDCLKRLEAGEVATLEIWLYDRNRKKGGGIDTLTCKLLQKAEETVTECRVSSVEQQLSSAKTDKRSPNHGFFYTRNVRIMVDGHPSAVIRKIHPPLIKSFNGIKTVP